MFSKKSDHILVVKTDGIAGFVAAEPVFEAIRQAHPDSKISLLTNESLQRLSQAAPYFDQVAALPDARDVEGRKRYFQQLKKERFSRVYDLSAGPDSKKLQGALGPFGPKWFAAAPAARIMRKPGAGENLPNLTKFLQAVGMETDLRLPDFSWAMSARQDAANMQPGWFGISGAFGLLLPSISEEMRWPASHYAVLARELAHMGIMPVMAGKAELRSFGDELAHFAPEVVDLSGKTDHLQFSALAQEASFFISDDSEEVYLATGSNCAGVLLKKAGREQSAPQGRHVMTLTAKRNLDEIGPDFVLQSIRNMGLLTPNS